jgi:hypothetical protein
VSGIVISTKTVVLRQSIARAGTADGVAWRRRRDSLIIIVVGIVEGIRLSLMRCYGRHGCFVMAFMLNEERRAQNEKGEEINSISKNPTCKAAPSSTM